MASGYMYCVCDECPEITVVSDMDKPERCEECEERECDPEGNDCQQLDGHDAF